MVDLVNMMNRMPEISEFFSTPIKGMDEPLNLSQTLTDSLEFSLSPGDTQSFSAQMVIMQVSIQMTSKTGAISSPQAPFSAFDFSPEATARRIFDFSISMFAVYRAQNPDESTESALANFEQLARDAIDEGFEDAGKILDELGKLDEQINVFMEKTNSILEQLLEEFFHPEGLSGFTESESIGDTATFSSIRIEVEYQSRYMETMSEYNGFHSGPLQEAYRKPDQGSASSYSGTEYSLSAESMSISLNYAEESYNSTFQLVV